MRLGRLAGGIARSIPLCADQVRYLWPIADLKPTYSLLRNAIGLGFFRHKLQTRVS